MQRDFHPRGQAGMDRVLQDGMQRVCTETRNQPPAELAKRLEADQLKTIAFPQGSLIGDWKRGEQHRAERPRHDVDRQRRRANGGSCYNCHQLSPKEISYGTIGPSLPASARTRGSRPGGAALRLRQDLQRQGVQRVLADAAPRPLRAR